MAHIENNVNGGKMTVQIPFCGFYESVITDQIDQEDQYQRDWLFDEYGLDLDNVPGRCWIDIQNSVDYSKIAESFTSYYEDDLTFVLSENYGVKIPVNLEFKALHMPREYNFYSDIIEARIEKDTMRRIYAAIDREEFGTFLYERMRPRDGFIPHYSWKLEEYPDDVAEWPACICRLILEFIEQNYDEWTPSSWRFIEENSSHCWISDAIDFKTPEDLLEEISSYYDLDDPEDSAIIAAISEKIKAAA